MVAIFSNFHKYFYDQFIIIKIQEIDAIKYSPNLKIRLSIYINYEVKSSQKFDKLLLE